MPHADAYIGLGANLGDRQATLAAALLALGELPSTTLRAASSLYASPPQHADGPDYLNAVAHVSTALAPQALLEALHDIERAHGRERTYRNAPRTLDLDLLLHGTTQLAGPGLELPHPRLHERAFVLAPLAEIAPALVVPGRGPVAALRDALADAPLTRLP